MQLLYTLKINCQPRNEDDVSATTTADSLMDYATDNNASRETESHPQRAAAVRVCKNVDLYKLTCSCDYCFVIHAHAVICCCMLYTYCHCTFS